MVVLDGIWRLIDSRAWDEGGTFLGPPYGQHPMGQIMFSGSRMLAVLCRGDVEAGPDGDRGFSSYGGTYTFDGVTLTTLVDVASDPARIGGRQVRRVAVDGPRIILHPPERPYQGRVERREIIWEQVWRALDGCET